MKRPNILWIVTTQWRAQACGFAGDPNAVTPHLDALAASGVSFTQAVTPHPFGPFARAALLTGVPSPENGVRDYFDPLPVETRTVAHALNGRGYATAFFGKWHLAPRDPAAALVGEAHARAVVPPERRGGFQIWEGFESGFLLNDPWLHGTRWPEPARVRGYQSDVLCDRAADWIHDAGARARARHGEGSPLSAAISPGRDAAGAGWFCVVSLEAPHPPYDAPASGVAPVAPEEITLAPNVPRGGDAEMRARRELAGYYAHIAATDRAIGRLVAAAGADTIIVFTSVHGDMHGAHGLFRKGWPHEESIRVPLLVRAPVFAASHAAGRSSGELVSLLDLPAWTLAWADGRELPASRSAPQRISMPSIVALPHQCDRVWHGIRTAARKLVLQADGSPWLFFDLERDPLEQTNLTGDPARADELSLWRARV